MLAQQRVRSAIDKFKREVQAALYQQVVIAHTETVHGIVTARVPQQSSCFRAGVGSRDLRKRQRAMTVFASPCRDRRNQSMFRSMNDPRALAAVVNRVFTQESSH